MKVTKEQAISHLDSVIKKYEKAYQRQKEFAGHAAENLSNVALATQIEVTTSMVAALERLAPEDTWYYSSVEVALKEHGANNCQAIPALLGIIRALKEAYESGYLQEIQELIHADVFSDFLEMAEYLLTEGYKDPAAVIAGGVLEEHLRKLGGKHSIETTVKGRPKRAEAMNSELATHDVYNKLDQQSVTAWLALRNKAAHADYAAYTEEQVKLMHQGIRDFIARFPA